MIAGSPIGCLQIYGRNVALENVSDAKSMDKFDLIGMYEITCTIIGGSAQTRTKHDLKSRASEAGPAEVMKVTLKGEDHIVCAFGQGKNKSIIQAIVASKAKVDSGRMPNLLKAIEDFEKAMSKGNTVVELDDITLAAAGKLAKSESGWPLLAYKSENKKIPTLGFSVAQPEKNGPGQLAATYYYSSDKELKSVTQPAEPTKCAPLIEVDQATFWWLEFGDPNRNNHDPSTQRREWQPVWRQDGSNPLEFNSYHRCPGPWKTDSPLPFDLGPATLYIGSDSEEKQFYQGDLYEIFVDPDNSIKALPTG